MRDIKAYCINLKSRKDRRENMNWQFFTHGIVAEFIDAVGGVDVDGFPRVFINHAEYACLLSHIKVLEKAKKDGCHALILEDDISFVNGFNELLKNLVEYAEEYDVIHLSHWDNKKSCNGEMLYSMKGCNGTFGYLVNYDFIDILLGAYNEKDMPCDEKLGTLHGEYNIFGTYPPLCLVNEDYSDIRKEVFNGYNLKFKKV